MHPGIVLLLVSVGVNALPTKEFETGEALRKSRQLDLGLQEIIVTTDSQSSKNAESLQNQSFESLLKEYLSPASPSSSNIISASTQRALEFDSSSSTEKENLLCNLPFDFILCNRKKNFSKQEEFNTLTEDIKKPSVDLVPPFDDVERDAFTTSKALIINSESASEKYLAFNAFNPDRVVTTTRKPFAKKYSPFETAKQFTKPSKPQKENDGLKTAEPSIESRSYLPPQPEFASAAQTSVEVIRPKNEEEHHHHHHHHHHHDDNFDICADAFHSFLCAPLKPRKTITGAFPDSLRGQSTFIKYQKVLANREEEAPAPSNTFQNEYLPPEKPKTFDFGASFNSIRTTSSPPKTTPKAFSKATGFTSSPPVKSFAPPKLVLVPKGLNVNVPLNPSPSIPVIQPLKPSSTTPNTLLFYAPVASTSYPAPKSSPTLNEFNSIFRPTVTTTKPILKPSTQTPINLLSEKFGSSSSTSTIFAKSNTEKPLLPLFVPHNPQSTNEDRFYLPPLPSASFISTAKTISRVPEAGNSPFISTKISSPSPTQSTFSSSQRLYSTSQSTTRSTPIILSFEEPLSTTTKAPLLNFKVLSTTFKPTTVASPSFPQLPSKLDNSYLPPLPRFQPVANSISTTIKPFRPTPKKIVAPTKLIERPSNVDRSYLPPDPNVQPAAAQVDSVAIAPKVQNPFHHGRDLCTDPFHSFLCSAPKPRKRITGSIPSRFKSESSNTNELKVRPAQSSQKPVIVKLQATDSSVTQFTTSKPFPKQSTAKPFVASTAESKFEKIFPVQTEQKVFPARPVTVKQITPKRPEILKPSETKTAIGYDYSKPASAFPLPSQQISSTTSGYSYPKPQKPFPLPTELKEVVKSTPPPPARKPSPTNEVKGYQYPKPEQSFEIPQNQGYSYPKPQKQLVLPTETPSKGFSPVGLLENLGSAEFIPVNKLEKRSRLSQSLKFGERLRRRDKRHSAEGSKNQRKAKGI